MKHSAFTMIELIFVIVIIGILAAVALPKFFGVSYQAYESKVIAFTGTLNRTVGPSLWSKSLADGHNGTIRIFADADLNAQIDTDTNLGDAGHKLTVPSVANCTPYADNVLSSPETDNDLIGLNTIATTTIGAVVYNIKCFDGNTVKRPRFILTKIIGVEPEKVVIR